MLDALISGKLIKQPELKTSQNGKPYCQFLMAVHIGEPENAVISGIAFGSQAERISKLGKGDAVSVIGALKPTEWQDKATNETKHGLSVTVGNVLSVYDISKKRKADMPDNSTHQDKPPYNVDITQHKPFDDGIGF
ncbi:MAG: single-stranded DNA-binding protein [Methyloglobulus sp.]|nr:single-stranded DNA-binding protein [Methyloglobulus sp.]